MAKGESNGKKAMAKSGGATAWVDNRRKGWPTAAAAGVSVDKQRGNDHGGKATHTDSNVRNRDGIHGDPAGTTDEHTEKTSGDEATDPLEDAVALDRRRLRPCHRQQ